MEDSSPQLISELVDILVSKLKSPQDGTNGIDGRNGRDGRDGRDGIDGINGLDGKPGPQGPKGDRGDKGDKGDPGKDAIINENELINKILQRIPPQIVSTEGFHVGAFETPIKGGSFIEVTKDRSGSWVITNTAGASTGTAVVEETPTGTVDGNNQTFTLAHTPTAGSVKIFLNGMRQQTNSDFTISNATITFTSAPIQGSIILVDYTY